MRKLRYKRGLALFLTCLLAVNTCLGFISSINRFDSYAYTERSATTNTATLNVRSGPGTTYSIVTKLSKGTAVTVIGESNATDGALWYQIRFSGGNTGYASSAYISFDAQQYKPDSNFESYLSGQGFPESYKPALRQLHAKYPNWVFKAQKVTPDWNTVIREESVVTRNLVARSSVSSWKSTATGAYDWNSSTWPGFDGSSWVAASEDIIKYYMDPRNFLDETYIFQFMVQSYNSNTFTREGLTSMMTGTFLSGSGSSGAGGGASNAPDNSGGSNVISPGSTDGPGSSGPGSPNSNSDNVSFEGPHASITRHNVDVVTAYGPGMDSSETGSSGNQSPGSPSSGGLAPSSGSRPYVDIILDAASQSGVNPCVLAAIILQEQSNSGSPSISGTQPGYEGYYNFFNIEAYASGSLTPVQRGLWWASQSGSYNRPWNTVEKAIIGGSMFYGENYVKAGQDTFYLKKFNVQGNNMYKHQYMTNVQAAAAEGAKFAKGYTESMRQMALEFKIPVYSNMPDTASLKPVGDGSPNNKLSYLGVDGFALTPTFNRDTESYDLIVDSSVASITVSGSVLDSAASLTGTGNIQLQSGNNDITVAVTAQNGTVRNYTLHVVRQNNGPVYSDGLSGGSQVSPGGTSGPGSSPGSGQTGSGTVNPDGSSGTPSGGSGTPSGGSGTPSGGSGTPSGGSGTPSGGSGTSSGGSGTPGGSSGSSGGPSGPGGSSPGGGSGGPGSGVVSPDGSGQSVTAGSYTIDGGRVVGILPGISASDLCSALQSSGVGSIVKVYTADGAENTGVVGTGNLIQTYDGSGNATSKYEAVVKGDNSGDGKLNIVDVMKVQRHILGLEVLTGPYEKASDINGNGKIDVMDLLKMQRDILNIEKIN